MANLKRYTMVVRRDEKGYASPALKIRQKGEVVKFEDIKEYLPSASHNTDIPKCKTCKHADKSSRESNCIHNYTAGTKGCFALRKYL